MNNIQYPDIPKSLTEKYMSQQKIKKYRFRKTLILIISFLFCWLIFAQSCMKFRISDSEAKKEFEKSGIPLTIETFSNNGFRLHYAKTGSDSLPTLFFVHGSPGAWDAFIEYMKDPELRAKYRMISIDRPGFGYSQFGNAKDMQTQSGIISPLLLHLQNGKPFCIIGHSLGGPMAVKLAADNPGFFKAVVLLAASVDPAEEAPEKWRSILYHTPLQYLLPGAFRPSNTELWYFKKDIIPLSKQFAAITSDVWIVHGDKDKFVPVGNAAYAKKMLVHANSVNITILKDAPHFIPWAPWYEDVKKIIMGIEMEKNDATSAK